MPEKQEARYKVKDQSGSRIRVMIWVPSRDRPIQHSVPKKKAVEHQGSIQDYIEGKVEEIAAREAEPDIDEKEIPGEGSVEFEPETPDVPPGRKK